MFRFCFVTVLAAAVTTAACTKRIDDLTRLADMPTIREAVVAPDSGRLFPSRTGPPGTLTVPNQVFAMDETLARIRSLNSGNNTNAQATIHPGDLVDVLTVETTEARHCLVRTRQRTFCWISSSCLSNLPTSS